MPDEKPRRLTRRERAALGLLLLGGAAGQTVKTSRKAKPKKPKNKRK